jgi:hypothetical protein
MANFRLATDEDLERIFGSERLLIGSPIRPTSSSESSSPAAPSSDSETTSDSFSQTNADQ